MMQYITVIIVIYFRFSISVTADMKYGAEHSIIIIEIKTRDVTVHTVQGSCIYFRRTCWFLVGFNQHDRKPPMSM